ncbi:MAG: hypothetical protein A2046_08105 [Bacteroidetes bacterium GWA2_30_7]|nr:MAG: hypothetical protein A2046_08105 [Bacteroidetes bacterium GWA2_30_7]
MKTKKLKGIILAIAIIISSTLSIKAQDFEKGMLKNIPNLTEEQTKKIESLKTPHLKQMLPIKNQLGEKKAQLNTLSTAEKADMVAINKKIDEIGDLKTQMMKNREAHKQEIRKILTEEQRLIFDMHNDKKEDKRPMANGKGMNRGPQGKGMIRPEPPVQPAPPVIEKE